MSLLLCDCRPHSCLQVGGRWLGNAGNAAGTIHRGLCSGNIDYSACGGLMATLIVVLSLTVQPIVHNQHLIGLL